MVFTRTVRSSSLQERACDFLRREEAGSVSSSLTSLGGVHSDREIFLAPRESMRLSSEGRGNVPVRVRVLILVLVLALILVSVKCCTVVAKGELARLKCCIVETAPLPGSSLQEREWSGHA